MSIVQNRFIDLWNYLKLKSFWTLPVIVWLKCFVTIALIIAIQNICWSRPRIKKNETYLHRLVWGLKKLFPAKNLLHLLSLARMKWIQPTIRLCPSWVPLHLLDLVFGIFRSSILLHVRLLSPRNMPIHPCPSTLGVNQSTMLGHPFRPPCPSNLAVGQL